MINDRVFYQALLESLSVLGKPNVDLVLRTLEKESIIQDGKVDRARLEPALRSIFGDGAKVLVEFAKRPKTIP